MSRKSEEGRGIALPLNHPQRRFISEAWLIGMSQNECCAGLVKHYGNRAVLAFVPLLWELRRKQLASARTRNPGIVG